MIIEKLFVFFCCPASPNQINLIESNVVMLVHFFHNFQVFFLFYLFFFLVFFLSWNCSVRLLFCLFAPFQYGALSSMTCSENCSLFFSYSSALFFFFLVMHCRIDKYIHIYIHIYREKIIALLSILYTDKPTVMVINHICHE